MLLDNNGQNILKATVFIMIIVIGVWFESIGVDMLNTTSPIKSNLGDISCSSGLALLFVGLILILSAIALASKYASRFDKYLFYFIFIIGIVIGIQLEFVGIGMLKARPSITSCIGNFHFSTGLIVLAVGLILILVSLREFSKMGNTNVYQSNNTEKFSFFQWLRKYWWNILTIIFAICFIFIYSKTHYQLGATTTENSVASADKYTILVDLILIIIGLIAAVGFGIFKWISKSVDERIKKESRRVEDYRLFTTAITLRNVGYISWLTFNIFNKQITKKKNLSSEEMDSVNEFLDLAISHTRQGINFSKKLSQNNPEYFRETNLCKGNFVYYLAEKSKINEKRLNDHERKEALDLAREILVEVSKENCPDRFYEIQESAAWAKYHLTADDDRISKKEACKIIHRLKKDSDIPINWREGDIADWNDYLKKYPKIT